MTPDIAYQIEAMLPEKDGEEYLVWDRDTDVLAAGNTWDEAVENFRKAWEKHGRDSAWLEDYLAAHTGALYAEADAVRQRGADWEARLDELHSARMPLLPWCGAKLLQALTLGRRRPTSWRTESERIAAILALRTEFDAPGEPYADTKRTWRISGARTNQLLDFRAERIADFQRQREDALTDAMRDASEAFYRVLDQSHGDWRAAMRRSDEARQAYRADWERRWEEAQALRHLKY